MKVEMVYYKDDPVKYEKNLRDNLNLPIHTKESLINCAVNSALAAERYWLQLQDLEERHGKLRGELNMAIGLLKAAKNTDTKKLANILESELKAENIANFLRLAHDGVYVNNREFAKKPRKDFQSKEQILAFRDKWIDEYELANAVRKENGWKKAYIREHQISYKTLNKIIGE